MRVGSFESLNRKNSGKNVEALRNQLADHHLKQQKHSVNDSAVSCLDQQKKKSALPELPKHIRRTLIPKKTTEKKNFERWHFITRDLLFSGGQKTRKQL